MDSIGSIGATIRESVGNGFAYALTNISNNLPSFVHEIVDWVHLSAYPFIINNSLFVALGTLGFAFLSSTMYVSNMVIDSRRELFRLASESKPDSNQDTFSLKQGIPKSHENIFVFTNKSLDADELHSNLEDIFELCGLNTPHFTLHELVSSMKQLNYHISFHDYSELHLKQMLLNSGWNFNIINQAFMVIDMEMCNEIAGAHMNLSQYELAEAMKSVKELASNGYTKKKMESYLLSVGHKKKQIKNIFNGIYKVQKLHDKMKHSQERRIQRAIRLNKVHSHGVFDGEFNS